MLFSSLYGQAYEAELRIAFVKNHPTTQFDSAAGSPHMQSCVNIAAIALEVFVDECIDLVANGVKADISHALSSTHVSEDERDLHIRRKKILSQWRKTGSRALSISSLSLLLRSISIDNDAVGRGLPSHSSGLSSSALSRTLLDMARPNSPVPIRTPVQKSGIFLPVLQTVVSHLMKLAPSPLSVLSQSGSTSNPTSPAQNAFVICALTLATEMLSIDHIPWSKIHSGLGRPSHAPVWNSWRSIDADDQATRRLPDFALNPSQRLTRIAQDTQTNAANVNPASPWAVGSLSLSSLPSILHKIKLPSDWILPSSMDDYILNTYIYVQSIYNRSNTIHHLALLVGIIISHSLPELSHSQNLARDLAKLDRKDIKSAIFNSEWTAKSSERGMKEKPIFVCMAATFLIALYDCNSPLRIYMREHENGMGTNWTKKHRKLHLILLTTESLCLSVLQAQREFNLSFLFGWAYFQPLDRRLPPQPVLASIMNASLLIKSIPYTTDS